MSLKKNLESICSHKCESRKRFEKLEVSDLKKKINTFIGCAVFLFFLPCLSPFAKPLIQMALTKG
jgi:hypothetical protein